MGPSLLLVWAGVKPTRVSGQILQLFAVSFRASLLYYQVFQSAVFFLSLFSQEEAKEREEERSQNCEPQTRPTRFNFGKRLNLPRLFALMFLGLFSLIPFFYYFLLHFFHSRFRARIIPKWSLGFPVGFCFLLGLL